MTKLNDLQLILLAAAAQRDDGSLLPPPERLDNQSVRIRKAIPPLIKRALVEENAVTDAARMWREDGEAKIGLAITAAGRAMIATAEEGEPPIAPIPAVIEATPPAKPTTKIGSVVAMLSRETGATLVELTDATGWLPHTTRAALTGLRKKGHSITKADRDGATTYLIAAAA